MENSPNPNWERQALEHLLLENLKETRKARRWKAVLRVLTLLVIVSVVIVVFDFHLPGRGIGVEKHTAMVTLEGEIHLLPQHLKTKIVQEWCCVSIAPVDRQFRQE